VISSRRRPGHVWPMVISPLRPPFLLGSSVLSLLRVEKSLSLPSPPFVPLPGSWWRPCMPLSDLSLLINPRFSFFCLVWVGVRSLFPVFTDGPEKPPGAGASAFFRGIRARVSHPLPVFPPSLSPFCPSGFWFCVVNPPALPLFSFLPEFLTS